MNPDSRGEPGPAPPIEFEEERGRADLQGTSERRQAPAALWIAVTLIVVLAIVALVAF